MTSKTTTVLGLTGRIDFKAAPTEVNTDHRLPLLVFGTWNRRAYDVVSATDFGSF